MENLLENEIMEQFKNDLKIIKIKLQKEQSQIDEEIERVVDDIKVFQNIEEIIQKKNKSIEKMKELVKETEDFLVEAKNAIQKEEFNCFVMKNKCEETRVMDDGKNEKKIYLQSRKMNCIEEEFEDCIISKEKEEKENKCLEEEKISLNQKQNSVIELSLGKLQEWSEKNEVQIIYDSDLDGIRELNICKQKEELFFFVFDSKENAFGWYLPTGIKCNEESEIFFCSLQQDKQFVFEKKENEKKVVLFGGEDSIFEIKEGDTTEVRICLSREKRVFSQMNEKAFIVNRIIIIQMICDDCLDVISDNLLQLKEWSGLEECCRLFDTAEDDENGILMKERLYGESNVFILCVDEYGNVFGCYIQQEIESDMLLNSKNHFIFAFDNTNDLTGSPQQWRMKKERLGKLFIGDDDMLFSCGDPSSPFGMIVIFKSSFNSSFCASLSNVYENIQDSDLNGTCFNDNNRETFSIQRLIVLKMS